MQLKTIIILVFAFCIGTLSAQLIPLAEHPRPDFQRSHWVNLNGEWAFEFDSQNVGLQQDWSKGTKVFTRKITVPFPWGAALSGVKDEADIAWYSKTITVDKDWQGKRIFITVGASDWQTTVWLDGQLLGTHRGGYTPFSFELTSYVKFGQSQKIVIRVDDKRRDFTLYGKQGYGNARGIWQTVYLEARGQDWLDAVHFLPNIDDNTVQVTAYLPEIATKDLNIQVTIKNANTPIVAKTVLQKGKNKATLSLSLPNARLWQLDDPFLYEAEVKMADDVVNSYFGMRKISVVNLPNTNFPYIALNNKPIYLQLALDQAYHAEGFYTFPSDQFMREEIERSKAIGLNGIRTHIKVEIPRKLYWADKLGLLVMSDLPNSWGEPDEQMQAESEYTLRQMIKRDFNHPAIFSWIVFNETWGLVTEIEENGKKTRKYLSSTQNWVASMYYLAKSLDASRLVEDNSICCGAGHTETDINSWHYYLPGWEWEDMLKTISDNTFPGSTHHFEKGFQQGTQPNINSECGNVWGYEGSTGDVDWSWDYHRMMNTFRKYPKIAGWLYTEHHDVINEWNGYWRFDRTEKQTGVGEIVPGMQLRDFHAPVYISTGNEICKTVKGGEIVQVPLFLSSMSDKDFGNTLKLQYELELTNYIGETEKVKSGVLDIPYQPWSQTALTPLSLNMPTIAGLAVLKLTLTNIKGEVLHRNFMHFEIVSSEQLPKRQVFSTGVNTFVNARWSAKQWNILEDKKANGAGTGFFEYKIPVPKDLKLANVQNGYFLVELSAKTLFEKDKNDNFKGEQDYMKGAVVFPSSNPNAYPMTDETLFPSTVHISFNGIKTMTTTLPDDPADHRGVLSWHYQLTDRKLREAGSYGYMIKVPVSKSILKTAVKNGYLTVKLQTDGDGGIAVYGKQFGKYAFDPSLVVITK